jgi:hypothetical protein
VAIFHHRLYVGVWLGRLAIAATGSAATVRWPQVEIFPIHLIKQFSGGRYSVVPVLEETWPIPFLRVRVAFAFLAERGDPAKGLGRIQNVKDHGGVQARFSASVHQAEPVSLNTKDRVVGIRPKSGWNIPTVVPNGYDHLSKINV